MRLLAREANVHLYYIIILWSIIFYVSRDHCKIVVLFNFARTTKRKHTKVCRWIQSRKGLKPCYSCGDTLDKIYSWQNILQVPTLLYILSKLLDHRVFWRVFSHGLGLFDIPWWLVRPIAIVWAFSCLRSTLFLKWFV